MCTFRRLLRFWLLPLLIGVPAVGFSPAVQAQSQMETVIEVATRGQRMRALLINVEKPIGSVILLAGGHGNLSLGANGSIGWGAGNQLVRSRARFARAGFATVVPDIAPDLKNGKGGVPRYRWSNAYARDIGALVKHMRGIAQPVYLIGTSRAALSVGKAAVTLAGTERPEAIVITSGMLMHISNDQPSVERNVGGLERINYPTLLVAHEKDGCAYTPASAASRFKAKLTNAHPADVKILSGGGQGKGDPCQAFTHHGFLGQDEEVVQTITDWLKKLH